MADVDPTARGLAVKALQHGAANFPANNATYISDYVVGDNVTDDHVAFANAVTAWFAAARTTGSYVLLGDLIINKPVYFNTSTVTITAPVGYLGGRIVFTNGAFIRNAGSQVGLLIQNGATNSWLGLEILDAFFVNSALRLVSHDDLNAMYQVKVQRLNIWSTSGGAPNHALSVEGVYESTFDTMDIGWDSTTKSCMSMSDSATGGTCSSNTVTALITRLGKHGYEQLAYGSPPVFTGCTFLEAYQEGVYIQGYNALFDRCHFENNCASSGQDGCYVDGMATFVACESFANASSPSGQKYGIHLYGIGQIIGGWNGTDIAGTKLAYLDGGPGQSINLVGDPSFVTYDINPGSQVYVNTGFNGPAVLVTGGSAQSITTATTTTLTLGTLAINQTGATLATNQVTVPAGLYLIEADYNGRAGSSSAATIAATLQIYNNTGAAVIDSNQKTIIVPSGNNEPLYLQVKAIATLGVTTALSMRMVSTVSAGTLALSSDTGTPHYLKLTRLG